VAAARVAGAAWALRFVLTVPLLSLALPAQPLRAQQPSVQVPDQAPVQVPAAAGQPTVIRPRGPQFGYPDPDDASRFVWVFLNGVEVEQAGRRLVGDTLVVVLRAAGQPTSTLVAPPQGAMQFAGERLLELYLDGNVRVEEGGEQVSGASAFHLDGATGVATVVEGELRTEVHGGLPLVARFALLKRLQDGRAFMRDLTYTSCSHSLPHWHIETPYALLRDTPDGRLLSTGHNLARVRGLPVLWLPGVDLNVDRDRMLLSRLHLGHSSRFGTEVETRWVGDVSPFATGVAGLFGADTPVEAEFDLGVAWYSRRGLLVEPIIEYRTQDSRGRLLGAYIDDEADTDHLEQPIEDSTRGRIDLEHRTRIDEHKTLDVEISRESDRGFLDEYYEGEAKEDKPQETYVSYRDVVDNHALTAFASTRLNDFDTQVEYQPELAARQAGEALPGGFFMTAKEFVSNAALRPDEDTGADSVRDLRAGVTLELSRPWDLPNGDRVQLVAQADLTGFEDTLDEGSALRHAAGVGVEWSRTYSGTGPASSKTWNLDGLRRIVEPRIGVFDRFSVSMTPDELLVIDQVEELEEVTVIELGLRDRIQTHQAGQVATLLDTDLTLPLYPREGRDNDGDTYGPLRLDTLWRPAADVPGLRAADLHWRAEFDLNDGHYVESFLSYSTRLGENRRLGLSRNTVFHEFDYRTLGFAWKLNPKWDVGVYYQQDAEQNQTARSGLVLRQLAHCWYIDIELTTRQGTDVNGNDADENEFTVRFQPAAFESNQNLVDEMGGRIP
jgi:hypothetical protein